MVADPDFTGGVLVLPGGKPNSLARSRPWQLAHLRVALLTGALRRRLPAHIQVRRVAIPVARMESRPGADC